MAAVLDSPGLEGRKYLEISRSIQKCVEGKGDLSTVLSYMERTQGFLTLLLGLTGRVTLSDLTFPRLHLFLC